MNDKAAASEEEQKGIRVHDFALQLATGNAVVFGQVIKYADQCDQVSAPYDRKFAIVCP